ncbi:MAG TPA: TetR family transcriptional regulator [Pseudonocardiaceae bacterium]|nr:TetR family transcriptional regulator [Pseudonocardiaceae bacterium]
MRSAPDRLPDSPAPPLGLRERKKARTRAAIRDHAMRLFREQGYAETTVDQIADAAEVSPSTFFRYFPTKEDVVLGDEFDPLIVEAFRAQPLDLTPIQAVRAALKQVFADMPADAKLRDQERHELIRNVPELRIAILDEYTSSFRLLASLVAERLGREQTDLRVRVFSGAMVGVALAALEDGRSDESADVGDLLDEALGLLEAGLPL